MQTAYLDRRRGINPRAALGWGDLCQDRPARSARAHL